MTIYPFQDVFYYQGQKCRIYATRPYNQECGCCPGVGFSADIELVDGSCLKRVDWRELDHRPDDPMSFENRVRAAGWRDMDDYQVIYSARRDFRWPDSVHLNGIPLKSFWETLPKDSV